MVAVLQPWSFLLAQQSLASRYVIGLYLRVLFGSHVRRRSLRHGLGDPMDSREVNTNALSFVETRDLGKWFYTVALSKDYISTSCIPP